MIPETFPVFTTADILPPPSEEYESGDQKSTVGWLKHLFLWRIEGDHLVTTDKDRKEYLDAEADFKKVNKIPKGKNLHEWEDNTSPAKQSRALNNLRRHLGYTVIEEEHENKVN